MAEPQLLAEVVRRHWDKIDWAQSIPADTLVIPEAHYMDLEGLGLTASQRVGLNRLLACFTCELFVHFEAFVIYFLEARARDLPWISRAVIARFVAEERVHSDMFRRLLQKLRPDLYPAGAPEDVALRFLRWERGDRLVLRVSPVGTFFVLAWLFEEVTLFMPRALDAVPEQASALLSDVMRLHAREEQPHVAIDARVMAHLSAEQRRLRTRVETALSLPLLAYVDRRVGEGWKRLVAHAAGELALTPRQRARLASREPTQSDRWGVESFVAKLAGTDLAGARLLSRVLRFQVRQSAA